MEDKEFVVCLKRIRALRDVSPETLEAVLAVVHRAREETRALAFEGTRDGLEVRAQTAFAADGALRDLQAVLQDPTAYINMLEPPLNDPKDASTMKRVKALFAPWLKSLNTLGRKNLTRKSL